MSLHYVADYGVITDEEITSLIGGFTSMTGTMPFCRSNVNPGNESEDLTRYINQFNNEQSNIGWNILGYLLSVSLPCYAFGSMELVQDGQYMLTINNGRPKIYCAGRYLLQSPVEKVAIKTSVGDDCIRAGPISIIRVSQGQIGLAMNNSKQELLLPGVHARRSAAFKYFNSVPIDQEVILWGPIKIVTVKSGEVQVCYDKGKVQILKEGRYAINSGPFRVSHTIKITQANMRFSKHPVLLDGGISLLVEGLLTYQVMDVEKLIKELGDRDLSHAIEDVTKAEIARVFAGIHLEQISTATTDQSLGNQIKAAEQKANSLLGSHNNLSLSPTPGSSQPQFTTTTEVGDETSEFEERSKICEHIIQYVKPITDTWGVKLHNFQLESTKIADEEYASEYEAASLGMAKAKANLRAVDAENDILLRQAEAQARAAVIGSQGRKAQIILEAKGQADARKIEAISRNEAAKVMTSEFARQYALQGQQVEFASKLKAQVLTVLPNSIVGDPIVSQQLLSGNNKLNDFINR